MFSSATILLKFISIQNGQANVGDDHSDPGRALPQPKQLDTAHRKTAADSSRRHPTVAFVGSILPAASARQRGASVESGKS